jgi:Mycobacterium 19 kDa lipoprotein antigen
MVIELSEPVGTSARQPGSAPRMRKPGIFALLAVGLVATGCASGASALGTPTARITINGNEIAERPTVRCQQVEWVWLIETIPPQPGFNAQVRTGASVEPLSMRIDDLGGFTGGVTNATPGATKATVVDGSFVITGTADGFYDGNISNTGTATFEVQLDC